VTWFYALKLLLYACKCENNSAIFLLIGARTGGANHRMQQKTVDVAKEQHTT
jgi:hypothetical protein